MYKFEREYIIEDGYLQLQAYRIFCPKVHIDLVQEIWQHPYHYANQRLFWTFKFHRERSTNITMRSNMKTSSPCNYTKFRKNYITQ